MWKRRNKVSTLLCHNKRFTECLTRDLPNAIACTHLQFLILCSSTRAWKMHIQETQPEDHVMVWTALGTRPRNTARRQRYLRTALQRRVAYKMWLSRCPNGHHHKSYPKILYLVSLIFCSSTSAFWTSRTLPEDCIILGRHFKGKLCVDRACGIHDGQKWASPRLYHEDTC